MSPLIASVFHVLKDAENSGHFMSTPEVHREVCRASPERPVVKTVLRALQKLLDEQLVDSEKRGTALVWRKRAGARGIAAKSAGLMTHEQALALQTLKRFSSRQIPSLVAESLSSLFDTAEKRLGVSHNDSERRYRKWVDKVEVESGAFALQHPAIDSNIFSTVSRALFFEQKIEVVYRVRSKGDQETAKIIDPLGLVEVGGVIYLVAAMVGYPKPAMYRLDRVVSATMLPEIFTYPREFSLAEYVKHQRQFDFMVEGTIKLELRFLSGAGNHLIESPLSDDQVAEYVGAELRVMGTVLLSKRLRWWLRAFGPNVEVVGPAMLREEMAKEAETLAALYATRA
ncbi:YafY family protein [Achromobacter sp. JUb104]|uniref:helix-turn-helix transcriptional regulator n=1 Tax=Achromobacter sp. JUb104 TaxID=2940590 RepID=UPI00216A26B7|nr:WYL domain-containing protein [Achromobacter sp. JUb104]MCS3507474.1 putative DNA-binding transcriptional regulator YafY [Achromobacter sp. JUb104]